VKKNKGDLRVKTSKRKGGERGNLILKNLKFGMANVILKRKKRRETKQGGKGDNK